MFINFVKVNSKLCNCSCICIREYLSVCFMQKGLTFNNYSGAEPEFYLDRRLLNGGKKKRKRILDTGSAEFVLNNATAVKLEAINAFIQSEYSSPTRAERGLQQSVHHKRHIQKGMNFPGVKLGISLVVILVAIAMASSKSIDVSEPEPFQKNQVEFSNSLPDDPPSEAELFKYLLTKELLNRHGNFLDWEERQRKRSYWKQCAFNAVSCFGKK